MSATETFTSATEKLELIVGRAGMERLQNAHVMVLGLGGVGSNCVEALARSGIGRLTLIDCDVVQESNINRQAIAFYSTLGQKKTQVAKRMVEDINPSAHVEVLDRFLLPEDIPELFAQEPQGIDFVVDAIDTVSTKLALAELLCDAKKPKAIPPRAGAVFASKKKPLLISSMGAANKLHPECIAAADISQTKNCPLCRVMRKECRKRGIAKLKVVYSSEAPFSVAPREGACRGDRSNLGTVSFMPPMMGQFAASQVICALAGLPAMK